MGVQNKGVDTSAVSVIELVCFGVLYKYVILQLLCLSISIISSFTFYGVANAISSFFTTYVKVASTLLF